MIEKLTTKQEAQMEVVRDYWINLALNSGDEIDEVGAKKGIDWLYTQANLPKVEMLLVDSPLGIQYAFHLLKEMDKEKIRNSVWNSVGNSVGNSVWNSVWNSVRNSVGNSVWNSVGNSVWNSVENSVENSVRKEKLQFHDFNYQNLTNIGWFAFYDYFYDFNLYDEETKKNFNTYKNFLKSGVFFSSCYSDIAIVSRRPKGVKKNIQGQLHSEISPAIYWRDGYELYFLDGIELEKEMWEKIINKTLSAKEAIKIKNADVRNIAMKYLGGKKILEELKGTMTAKDDYGELWTLEGIKDSNGNPYVYFTDLDPSKNGEPIYLRTSPQMKTPQEAMTRAYKLSQFKMVYKPSIRT